MSFAIHLHNQVLGLDVTHQAGNFIHIRVGYTRSLYLCRRPYG